VHRDTEISRRHGGVADGMTPPPPLLLELLVADIGPLAPGTIWAYCAEGVRNIEAAIESRATVFII
jgi:hypothetical protein